jgi:hypothetical protein
MTVDGSEDASNGLDQAVYGVSAYQRAGPRNSGAREGIVKGIEEFAETLGNRLASRRLFWHSDTIAQEQRVREVA